MVFLAKESALHNILNNLKEEDIFINPDRKLPVDTSPLSFTFHRVFADSMDYHRVSDLEIPTIISTVNKEERQLVRISNIPGFRDEDKVTDEIVASMMATSAMPGVFPSISINDKEYIDGGTKEDIPINAVLEYERFRNKPFKRIIVIGIQRNSYTEWNTEIGLLDLKVHQTKTLEGFLGGLHYNMDRKDVLKDKLKKFNKQYPLSVTERVDVYVPAIQNFEYVPVLGFYDQQYQYDTVLGWSKEHEPLPLSFYLNHTLIGHTIAK